MARRKRRGTLVTSGAKKKKTLVGRARQGRLGSNKPAMKKVNGKQFA